MKSKFKGKKINNRYAVLTKQKLLIKQHYDFLQCEIDWRKNVLVCTGFLRIPNCSSKYKIQIEYVAGNEPKSTILFPDIEPGKEIHMYNDHSLCLHYPPDMAWNEKVDIYAYTIPWITEWIIYYELYKVNGNIWEGKESPVHIVESDKNINKEQY
jgi:hypothetical protein